MEFKVINILFLAAFLLVVNATTLPRDSSVVKVKPLLHIDDDTAVKDVKVELPEQLRSEVIIPGRVSCQYEEATEDKVCQEHCFPKGYKYGLCVSGICSCI